MRSFPRHHVFPGIMQKLAPFTLKPIRPSRSKWTALLFFCCQSSLVSPWTTISLQGKRHYGKDYGLSPKRYLSNSPADNAVDETTNIPPVPRLYNIEAVPLTSQAIIPLTEAQSSYINVMRLNSAKRWGAWTGHLRIFDETNGEWLAKLVVAENASKRNRGRNNAIVECIQLLRPPPKKLGNEITTHLYMGRIKKQRRKWVLEKVTELGIASIHAVDTEYAAVSDAWEHSKHFLQVVEASEQCERFTIPQLSSEPLSWRELVEQIVQTATNGEKLEEVYWMVCRERHASSKTLLQAMQPIVAQQLQNKAKASVHILVGPEGGWSPSELEALDELVSQENAQFVSLGPLVLRAETAAISAVAAVMMSLEQ